MIINCQGVATIEHSSTKELFEIHPDELVWEPTGGGERGMGEETVYSASVEHDELGELTWSLSEYPVGVENFKETDAGTHSVIRDFDYGLDHEPDPEDLPFPENLLDLFEANPNLSSSMGVVAQPWFRRFTS